MVADSPGLLPHQPRIRRDAFRSCQIPPQNFRDLHAAILLLVVLHDGDPGAPDGQAAAVQRMHKLRLSLSPGSEADVGAARLEALEVAARRNFPILALAGG